MFSNNCSDFYNVGVKSVFCPRASTGKRGVTSCLTGIETKGGFPLSSNFYGRTQIHFTRVNRLEAMYGRSRVNVKVEPRSAFTFTHGLPYIASILFTPVKFTCVRTEKLRDSGNQMNLPKTV